jgi:hypothetical protein
MSSRGKQAHKKSTDIQRLEWDKRKKKREELCNLWNSQKSNRKMIGEGHPDRAREQSESEMNRPELEITTAAMTPERSSDVELIEARLNAYQPEDEPESMDYEESGPMIHTSPHARNQPVNKIIPPAKTSDR